MRQASRQRRAHRTTGTGRRAARARRRGALAAVALLAAGSVSLAGPAAQGQDAPEGFVEGAGSAYAQVMGVVPRISGLNAAVTVGAARSQYQGVVATSSAQTLDPGFFGLLLTLDLCGVKLLPPDLIPAGLTTDSREGDRSDERTIAGQDGVAVGREATTARPNAFTTATAEPALVDLPGLLTISGAAHTEAELVPGMQRRASAVTELGRVSLLGGLVELRGMAWEASHRSGSEAGSAGGFTAGELSVAGVALPTASPAQLAAGMDAVNQILGPWGIRIQLPEVVERADGGVEVTPFRLTLGEGAQLAAVVGPLLEDAQPVRDAITTVLLGGGCEGLPTATIVGGALTVSDIVLGVLAGSGGLSLDLGGVRARTDATVYDDPFDDFRELGGAPVAGPVGSQGAPGRPGTPGRPPTPGHPAPSPGTDEDAVGGPLGALSRWCVTTSPTGEPGCSRGAGHAAVLLGAAAIGGLGALDWRRARRLDRRDPVEVLER